MEAGFDCLLVLLWLHTVSAVDREIMLCPFLMQTVISVSTLSSVHISILAIEQTSA